MRGNDRGWMFRRIGLEGVPFLGFTGSDRAGNLTFRVGCRVVQQRHSGRADPAWIPALPGHALGIAPQLLGTLHPLVRQTVPGCTSRATHAGVLGFCHWRRLPKAPSAGMRHLRLPEEDRFRQCFTAGCLGNVNRPSPPGRRTGGAAPGDLENLLQNSIIETGVPPRQQRGDGVTSVRGWTTQGEKQPLRGPARPDRARILQS